MEGELIFVAIIMQVGTILTIFVWSSLSLSKYFKKENFKISKSNVMATNKLNLRKLEIEMGLKPSKQAPAAAAPTGMLAQLAALAPLAAKLEPEQLTGLMDMFVGGGGDGEPSSFLDAIPPELITGFLEGLGKGKDEPTGTGNQIGQ